MVKTFFSLLGIGNATVGLWNRTDTLFSSAAKPRAKTLQEGLLPADWRTSQMGISTPRARPAADRWDRAFTCFLLLELLHLGALLLQAGQQETAGPKPSAQSTHVATGSTFSICSLQRVDDEPELLWLHLTPPRSSP